MTCLVGNMELRCDFQPRHDYARTVPSFRLLSGDSSGGAVQARGGRQTMTLLADIPLPFDDRGVVCDFTLTEGQTVTFVLSYGHGRPASLGRRRTSEKLDHTQRYWRGLVDRMNYEGLWRDSVVRSFLALHLMMYQRTGAIVAAPTTSLPETIGGSRNWDYRFSWLRDTAFTRGYPLSFGRRLRADHYMHWLLDQCQLGQRKTRIVYGISPTSSLQEYTLDHLSGYETLVLSASATPRLTICKWTFSEKSSSPSTPCWSFAEKYLRKPGTGPLSGGNRDGQLAAKRPGCVGSARRPATLRVLQSDVLGSSRPGSLHCRRYGTQTVVQTLVPRRRRDKDRNPGPGWSSSKQAFRQRYGSDALDASNLAIPFLGLIPRDDPRIRQNVDAIERELTEGPLVWRYLPEETDDGLEGQREGAFTLLSFWLIGNLIYTGQTDRGLDYFHEMITKRANHLGLFAEMFDPVIDRQLGNFPQAYSHTGLIHTALNLSGFIADTPTRRSNPVE